MMLSLPSHIMQSTQKCTVHGHLQIDFVTLLPYAGEYVYFIVLSEGLNYDPLFSRSHRTLVSYQLHWSSLILTPLWRSYNWAFKFTSSTLTGDHHHCLHYISATHVGLYRICGWYSHFTGAQIIILVIVPHNDSRLRVRMRVRGYARVLCMCGIVSGMTFYWKRLSGLLFWCATY